MYEIRPLADGYGLYKDGVYVLWAWSKERAEFCLREIEEGKR